MSLRDVCLEIYKIVEKNSVVKTKVYKDILSLGGEGYLLEWTGYELKDGQCKLNNNNEAISVTGTITGTFSCIDRDSPSETSNSPVNPKLTVVKTASKTQKESKMTNKKRFRKMEENVIIIRWDSKVSEGAEKHLGPDWQYHSQNLLNRHVGLVMHKRTTDWTQGIFDIGSYITGQRVEIQVLCNWDKQEAHVLLTTELTKEELEGFVVENIIPKRVYSEPISI
jgi:hypothetical protein